MDPATTNAVTSERKRQLKWESSLLFPVGATKVDLALAIGHQAVTPLGPPTNPIIFRQVTGSCLILGNTPPSVH